MRTTPTTPNPAPIDVLAVLKRQVDLALSYGNDERAEALQDISAAIAELIEASKVVVKPYKGDAYAGPDIERLEAALARVGGA